MRALFLVDPGFLTASFKMGSRASPVQRVAWEMEETWSETEKTASAGCACRF